MPFQRPTIAQLIARAVSDIQSRLPGANPLQRHSFLGGLARMHAGAMHGLYGFGQFISRQVVPTTAEAEYLDRWATLWLSTPRMAAVGSAGSMDFTGQAGETVPADLELQDDAGLEYKTTEAVELDGSGEATVSVVATDVGAATNLAAGVILNVIAPTAGVDSQATVSAAGLAGGRDRETDEALRERIRQRITNAPHGGAAFDYERWALEVSGVDRVWVTPLYDGDGTVQVWIGETDYDDDTLASAQLVSDVQDYIDPRAPVTADVTVATPEVVEQPITLTLFPDTVAVQEAVKAELAALFARDAEPEGTILISRIREAVSIAAGESNHELTVPSDDVTAGTGEILALGTVTFS